MSKKYMYGDFSFTDGDMLLLSYLNSKEEHYRDLSVVWNVGVDRDFIENCPAEGYLMSEGEGIPVGGDYEYPDKLTKINGLSEVIELSKVKPTLIKDIKTGDTLVFKTRNDEIYLKFVVQHEVNFDVDYEVISSVFEDGSESEFYIPVFDDELEASFDTNEGFVEFLGVLT